MSDDLDALWEQAKPAAKPAEDLDTLWEQASQARAAQADKDMPDLKSGGPTGPVTLGPVTTFLAHMGRHGTLGLQDKLDALLQSLSDKASDKTGKSFGDIYDRNLAFNDQVLDASDQAHPVARWAGNAAGLAANIAAMSAAAPARAAMAARGIVSEVPRAIPAATTVGRMLQAGWQGAKVGAATGALGGFGASRGGYSNDALGTGLGAVLGAGTGGALSAAGLPLSEWLARRAQPQVAALQGVEDLPLMARQVTPTPQAQTLQRYGVPLTLGQMDHGSAANVIEEGALRAPFLDEAIKEQRNAAVNAWRNAAVDQGLSPTEGPFAPGFDNGVPRAPTTIEKMEQIRQGFRQAYGQIADRPAAAIAIHPQTGEMVNPRQAFNAILQDPAYQADDQDLGIVRRLFEGEANKLDRTAAAGPIRAGDLTDMRSALREAAHTAQLSGNPARAEMFQDAADSMTGGLRATLPERDVNFLNRTDRAYSAFMRVRNAAYRAARNANEGEFGPNQLQSELVTSYGKRFAEDPNAGGSLRELARAGKAVFTPDNPLTGHGDALKGRAGLALGGLLIRSNENEAAQNAFMQAAREAFANGGQPNMAPAAAGPFGRFLARGWTVAPTASNSLASLLAGLGASR